PRHGRSAAGSVTRDRARWLPRRNRSAHAGRRHCRAARARTGNPGWRPPRMSVLTVERLTRDALLAPRGKVVKGLGLVIEATGPAGAVGDLCRLRMSRGEGAVLAEIVGFRDDRLLLMPLGDMEGVAPGAEVTPLGRPLTAPAGASLLGRVLD